MSTAARYRLHVRLDEIEPPVWRRLEVPADLPMRDVHRALQLAMGWSGAHRHLFAPSGDLRDPRSLVVMDDEAGGPDAGRPESEVRLDEVLAAPGDTLGYLYDLADSWRHTVRLEAVLTADAPEEPADTGSAVRLLDGARACPPEDVGGVVGYDVLRDAAAMLQHGRRVPDEVAEALAAEYPGLAPAEILAALDAFDVAAAARLLAGVWTLAESAPPLLRDLLDRATDDAALLSLYRDVLRAAPVRVSAAEVAAAVDAVAWFVRRVGTDGAALTADGYLDPVLVREAAQRLGLDEPTPAGGAGPGADLGAEEDVRPVLWFREVLTDLGLLRAERGRLTAAADAPALVDDPRALWDRIAAGLPVGDDPALRDAGAVLLLRLAGSDGAVPRGAGGGAGAAFGSAAHRGGADDPLAERGFLVDRDGRAGQAYASLGGDAAQALDVDFADVRAEARPTRVLLERLGGFHPDGRGYPGDFPTRVGVALARQALGAGEVAVGG
ncbi:plasmid pRiA4b ORF-3 family protein [Puerhibacterium puerhi]|uniref:plasmid pRiA4b ORF-3 family protein n=1 Tax=Puerhibacterium puerhi TaxID=2692623 RepID=UPI00135A5065|nr:plasmid pRiA4b ORF-3 family protein [Puerhibacterium puerhi]